MPDLPFVFSELVRLEIEVWEGVDARLRADHDVPLGVYQPLRIIEATPDCRVHDVAAGLGITVGGTSKTVDRLVAAGWAVRRPHPNDKRSSLVELTPAGADLVARAARSFDDELQRRLGAPLPAADLQRFSELLTGLRGAGHPVEPVAPELPATMRAVVLDHAPAGPEGLVIRELPVPVPAPGQVLIEVKAFGLNRSELHTRIGLAIGVTLPRVLGIEATGVVAACPGGEFAVGQQVVAMMGGMGRTVDGGYAEFTCVPAAQVIAFHSDLDWAVLGAVPEMLQTAHGSLTVGLDARPGQTLLIRGGTSSVGLAAAILAKQRSMTVLSTTRDPAKAAALTAIGVDHVIVDDGEVAGRVRALVPAGVDAALELVGSNTLRDTLRCVRFHGVACQTGMLSNQWVVPDFYANDFIPRGVRLTGYSGNASDLPPAVLQEFLDAVAAGRAKVPVGAVYEFDRIAEAHAAMESGSAVGKLVVRTPGHLRS